MARRQQRSWPETFEVTIYTNGGASAQYRVMTWWDREKAVVLAVEAHVSRHDQRDVEARISDVEINDLGPAERDATGVVRIGDFLTDRLEW